MADEVAAAIRRASQAARNSMRVLDEEATAELVRIYTEAADEVRRAIAAAGGLSSRVRLEQLKALLARIEAVLEALASKRNDVIDGALQQAADLGVRPLTDQGLGAAGWQGRSVLDRAKTRAAVDEAVAFVRAQRAEDGLALSDRLWRVDRGARDAVSRTIEQAVVQGWSADKAAQDFLLRGQAVPPATVKAQQANQVANVMRGADYLADESSGALANSLRVMRTEMTRAHGEAYAGGAAQAPGFVGYRFLLSPRHPRPDICDLFAQQNLYGLGPGVYPDRKSCPWPAHPATLSFIVAVFEDEVTAADRAGRETTLEALARMAPELRAGVLGPTKAEYFDRGLLTRGAVRSAVGAVRARLERQGRV